MGEHRPRFKRSIDVKHPPRADLAPLVGVLTQRLPAYRMVIFGSFVAASSVFIMTIPAQRFQRLADGRVGHAIAKSWLGGYSRFSPDDFRDLSAFAHQLQYGSNAVSPSLEESLSPITRARLVDKLTASGLDAKVILQVHDELVLEVREDLVAEVSAKIREHMSDAAKLDVPLVVDVGVGDNWDEAH